MDSAPIDFDSFLDRYWKQNDFPLLLTDKNGKVIAGKLDYLDCDCHGQSDRRRQQAAEHTRYWGEPVINLCCDTGYAMWAVPILDNNRLTGALVVQGIDLENSKPGFYEFVQKSAHALLQDALDANLLSRAEVALARQRANREHERFLAIEASKEDVVCDDIRSIYLVEEPNLLSAIRNGEIKQARAILNHILTGIYGLAGDRMDLLKSSVLELIVMMSRAAVEAGADPAAVLGRNYRSLAELAEIDEEEDLTAWLRLMLETLIEGIRKHDAYPHALLMTKAIKFMQNNLHQHLRRDDVAHVAGVSPSHFSKLVTERLGRSFSQLLVQMRVNRAKELLCQTDRTLVEIAFDCGFSDQSHFSKAFRAHTSLAPSEYRRRAK